MITVKYVDDGGKALVLTVEGHAGYAAKGYDIVCAGASMLMETLLYKLANVDEADAVVQLDPYSVPHIEAVLEKGADEEAKADMRFAAAGLKMLAERYPENVRFEKLSGEETMDLQLFAEGAAAGGAGEGSGVADAGEGSGEPAAQQPKMRPAEERLARRSGVLKRTQNSAGPASGQSGVDAGAAEKAAEAENEAGEEKDKAEETKPPRTQAERRKAFRELCAGEYKEEAEAMMEIAARAAGERLEASPALRGLMEALVEAYGTDAGDLEALTEAVKNGRVKDEKYYERLAMERGVSVKTAREMDKLEADNRRLTAAQQAAAEQRQAMQRQAEIRAIHAKWDAEAESLRAEYPDFDLQEALANPEMADLMRRGVSMSNAYRAIYFDRIMKNRTDETAKQVERGVVERIQQRAQRPAENGTRPGGAVQTSLDLNNTTRREREALERRALRGEKITFTI